MTTKIKTFGGNIGIGTTDPGDFKLNVNGSLKTASLVVNGVQNAQVPIGLIAPWYGLSTSSPSGWKLCDGSTYARTDGGGNITTPDLRTKFIRGADGDAPSPVAKGSTDGSNNVTLSTDNLAPHSHTVTVNSGNAPHTHNAPQVNPQHTHGGNSNSNNAPHDHENTGQTPINHSHVNGNSNYTNAPHSHGASGQSEALHVHGTFTTQVPHNHAYRDGSQNVQCSPGPSQDFGRESPTQDLSAYADAPHNHGRTSDTQSPHSHGASGQSSAPHTHPIANANTPHSHDTSANNGPHDHGMDTHNAPHSHNVSAVDTPHGHTASSGNSGQGTAFSVLNRYYALFYIMKI